MQIDGRERGRKFLGARCAPGAAEEMKRCDLSALAVASDYSYPSMQAGPLEQKESVDSRRRLLQLGCVVEAAAQQAGPA